MVRAIDADGFKSNSRVLACVTLFSGRILWTAFLPSIFSGESNVSRAGRFSTSSVARAAVHQRRYVATQRGQAPTSRRVRVLSQNILANSWISTAGRTALQLEPLVWESRLARLLVEIEEQRPDIITLQEVEQAAFHNDLRPRALTRGFDGVFSTKSGQSIGVAIFWQVSKLEPEAALHADLTDASQSRWYFEIAFGFSTDQINRYLHTARRTTLFVCFRFRPLTANEPQHMLLVGTTHLISTVLKSPTNLDVQTFQAVRTMEALDTIWSQQETRARKIGSSFQLLLTGDFNSPPYFPASVITHMEMLIQKATAEAKMKEEVLEDRSTHCRYWVAMGECLRNPGYMLVECGASCSSFGIGAMERRRLLCNVWVSHGDCKSKSGRMSALCPDSCAGIDAEDLTSGAIVRSPVYELVTQGFLSEDSIAFLAIVAKACRLHPSHILPIQILRGRFDTRKLRSAHAEALGHEPATCLGESLDYIFFSSGSGHSRLELLGIMSPPQPRDHDDSVRSFGSDHVPLVADFAIVPSAQA